MRLPGCRAVVAWVVLAPLAAATDQRPLYLAPAAPLGGVGMALVPGDFDEDGHIDLASATWAESDVRVSLGNGYGLFGEADLFPTAGGVAAGHGVVVLDFDGDGHDDLLVANNTSGHVSLHRGDGDGHLPLVSSWPAGDFANSLAPADFDGDGAIDVAVSHYFGPAVGLSVLMGDGGGGLAAPFFVGPAWKSRGVAAGDADGDGHADLALTDSLYDDIAVLLGNGVGDFAEPALIDLPGGGPRSILFHDLDGDADQDLLVGSTNTGRLMTLANLGGASFGPVHSFFATDLSPVHLVVADLDLDGLPDVVTANSHQSKRAAIFRGLGTTDLDSIGLLDGGGQAVAVADYDGDAVPDIATMTDYDGRATLYFGRGDFGFPQPAEYDEYAGLGSGGGVTLGDVDGDGLPDVARAADDEKAIVLRYGAGKGLLKLPVIEHQPLPPVDVAVGDVDSDGIADLVSAIPANDVLMVKRGTGAGGFLLEPMVVANYEPRDVELLDLDGDGVLDALTANETSHTVQIFHGESDAIFPSSQQLAVAASPARVLAADVDVDGDLDILTVNSTDDSVSLVRATPSGTYLQALVTPVPVDPRAAAVLDTDGDGMPKLAVVSRIDSGKTQGVVTLLGFVPGTGLATLQSLPVGNGAEDVVATDLDADGHTDLAVAHAYDPLFLLLSDGDGALTATQTAYDYGHSVAAGDLDLDGRMDLVTTTTFWGAIVVHLNVRSPWTRLGFGSAPVGQHEPELAGQGSLQPGSDGDLRLTSAPASSPCLVVIGLQPLAAPLQGALIYPAPDVILPAFTDPSGTLLISWSNLPALPEGTRLFFQDWLLTSPGPTVSNGLKAVVP